MAISHVSLGPNDSWILQYKNGSIGWSSGLPDRAYKLLNGRYNNKNQQNIPLKEFAMGDDNNYFASYQNGGSCYLMPDVPRLSSQYEVNVHCATIGPDSSYIVLSEAGISWNRVPSRANQLIETRNNSSLVWASLGINGTYFLMYSDGKTYWDSNNNKSLDKILSGNKPIEKVNLCASSPNYFVLFADGSSAWAVSHSLDNEILSDIRMSPQNIAYLNSSIKKTFSDGRSIKETMYGLRNESISVDDIPAITVIEHDGRTYSLNNRRLWAFKESGVESIPVIVKQADASFFSQLNRKLYDDIQIR